MEDLSILEELRQIVRDILRENGQEIEMVMIKENKFISIAGHKTNNKLNTYIKLLSDDLNSNRTAIKTVVEKHGVPFSVENEMFLKSVTFSQYTQDILRVLIKKISIKYVHDNNFNLEKVL